METTNTEIPASAASAADAASVAPAAAGPDDPHSRFAFKDMRLKVGERFQLELPAKLGNRRAIVKLIGYLEGECLFVTAPDEPGLGPLIEGDSVTVRAFSGQNAFGFVSHVEKSVKLPFPYLHLTFPKRIVGKTIRRSRRIRTELPAKIIGSGEALEGTLANLSASGAELRVSAEPGKLGDSLTLEFKISVHAVESALKLSAVIRSLSTVGDAAAAIRCGVEFQNLSPADKVQLQSLVYQELVERPEAVL